MSLLSYPLYPDKGPPSISCLSATVINISRNQRPGFRCLTQSYWWGIGVYKLKRTFEKHEECTVLTHANADVDRLEKKEKLMTSPQSSRCLQK